jgi:hypothetical protein
MAPESYIAFDGMKFGGQLKAMILLVLFVVSLVFRYEEGLPDSKENQVIESPALTR